MRARAKEILGPDAIPGTDFALTEVVRCKSRQEKGVAAAMNTCAELWLSPVLAQSKALVVVLLGKRAQEACSKIWGWDVSQSAHFGPALGSRERAVVLLPHPNAIGPKTVAAQISREDLSRLRGLFKD